MLSLQYCTAPSCILLESFMLLGSRSYMTRPMFVILRPCCSSYVTPVNSVFIPTGEYQKVEGTPFDFSTPTAIGKRLSKVPGPLPVGYDTNYVLWGRGQEEVQRHTRYCRALHRYIQHKGHQCLPMSWHEKPMTSLPKSFHHWA